MATENFLTAKLGPLPGWGWALVGAGGLAYWRHRQNAATAAGGTSSSASSTPSSSGFGTVAGGPPDYSAAGGASSGGVAAASGIPYTYSGGAGTPFTYSGPTDLNPADVASIFGAAPTGAMAVTAGSSPVGASNSVATTNPLPVSAPMPNPLAGWTYLPNYSAFQAARSAGKTIDYTASGSTSLQPFYAGGRQVGSAPTAGSRWYVKA